MSLTPTNLTDSFNLTDGVRNIASITQFELPPGFLSNPSVSARVEHIARQHCNARGINPDMMLGAHSPIDDFRIYAEAAVIHEYLNTMVAAVIFGK